METTPCRRGRRSPPRAETPGTRAGPSDPPRPSRTSRPGGKDRGRGWWRAPSGLDDHEEDRDRDNQASQLAGVLEPLGDRRVLLSQRVTSLQVTFGERQRLRGLRSEQTVREPVEDDDRQEANADP